MTKKLNQAVVFTKPLPHLNLHLTPEELDQEVTSFLQKNDLNIVFTKRETGPEMKKKQILRDHYMIYSQASYGNFEITPEGKELFQQTFNTSWDDELKNGRICDNPTLLKTAHLSPNELYLLWDKATQSKKIDTGLVLAWLDSINRYCVNGFYPAMEANFYHPDTKIVYHVVEFDPAHLSWKTFREEIIGATNASKAAPHTLRGQLFARHPVEFPARDNFVHASAGPFEGFIERTVHETHFDPATNPIGQFLLENNISLADFKTWKSNQSLHQLATLFDQTEETNSTETIKQLQTRFF